MSTPPVLSTAPVGDSLGPALHQRYHTLCAALDIAPQASPDRCERLIDALRDRETPRETLLYLMFQLFLARIPTPNELTRLARRCDRESSADLVRHFAELTEFAKGPQYRVHFESTPRSTLLVDVTNTRSVSFNSGIQRVVRCLGRELRAGGLDHALVHFDPELRAFRLLAAAEVEDFEQWEQTARRRAGEQVRPQLSEVVLARLRKIAGRRLSEAAAGFWRTWVEAGRAAQCQSGRRGRCRLRVAAPSEITRVAFVWENNLLLPEVTMERDGADQFRALLAHTPVTSTLVVYDLIPLHHPEFCLIGDGFVRYLTLLRTVDRVSCISQATADDVRGLLRLTPRTKAPPQVETHYLAGDFDRDAAVQAAAVDCDELPVVLSVGSIEARKNHRRMLRAMVLAQQQGCRFRGVFAGCVGWLNEDFLRELATYQAAGYQVELRSSVSEEELRGLYAQSAFTLYCSLVEGFGLPIVESIGRGIPCITSHCSSMGELAAQLGGCVTVDPKSETEIAAAIVALCHDRPRLERLRAEARQTTWPSWRDYARAVHEFASPALTEADRRTVAAA